MTIMPNKRKVTVTTEESSSDKDVTNEDAPDSSSDPEPMEEEDQKESDDSSDGEASGEDQDDALANEGWADSIAKILKSNKPKGKKTLVLAKAKKLTDIRKTEIKDAGFEVEAKDGERKREQMVAEDDDSDTEKPLRKKRKDLPTIRIKPNILEKDRERTLTKIATRGVVQLFNAVKNQQKDIDSKLKEAGPLEVKRDRVLKNIDKREFLNVLMGDKSKNVEKPAQAKETRIANKQTEEPTWNILRDDFMMGAKMKDWDKELESESEIEKEVAVESE